MNKMPIDDLGLGFMGTNTSNKNKCHANYNLVYGCQDGQVILYRDEAFQSSQWFLTMECLITWHVVGGLNGNLFYSTAPYFYETLWTSQIMGFKYLHNLFFVYEKSTVFL